MVESEPELFKKLDPYMKARQIMGSAIIFENHGWKEWKIGHAKLFGILLRDFETKKRFKFKYSTDLKKRGYGRTHNYRLLHELVRKNVLKKKGNGYYSLDLKEFDLLKGVVLALRGMDAIGNKEIPAGVKENRKALYRRSGF